MPATFTASAKFTAIDRISRVMRSITKASQSFAKRTELAFARVERRMRRLTSRIGILGVALGGALLIRAVTSTIGVFADFEQANASLASVMATATEPQLKSLALDAKRLGAITARSATDVVSLQEAFARLGFETPAIINMTQSTIAGSIAMKGPLADTAELVGAMVKSFDKFSSVNAPQIIDQLTKSTQKSALNFEKLQTGLPIVAGAANAAGIPFTRLLALMGKLSDAGIDTSSSATALRNIFIESAKRGDSYSQILANIEKNQDKLTAANDRFGKRAAVSATILAKNIHATEVLDKAIQNAAGTAEEAAEKQLRTLQGRMTLLSSAWTGFILANEDGTGALNKFLSTTIEVATQILSLASGTSKAESAMDEAEIRINSIAKKVIKFGKAVLWLVGAMVALKIAILANKAVLIAANFIRFAIVFTKIARANGIWTAAQWALNFALSANPIGLIIIGVAALIALVAIIIKKWDTWGAALSLFLGPLGMIIALVQSFRKSWDLLKASFEAGGIVKGLITIGKVLLDAILFPIQQLLQLLSKIPGLDIAATGASKIEAFRNKLFEHERALIPEQTEDLNTTNTETSKESIKREERLINQQATLNINNNTGFDTELNAPLGFPISLSPTN